MACAVAWKDTDGSDWPNARMAEQAKNDARKKACLMKMSLLRKRLNR